VVVARLVSPKHFGCAQPLPSACPRMAVEAPRARGSLWTWRRSVASGSTATVKMTQRRSKTRNWSVGSVNGTLSLVCATARFMRVQLVADAQIYPSSDATDFSRLTSRSIRRRTLWSLSLPMLLLGPRPVVSSLMQPYTRRTSCRSPQDRIIDTGHVTFRSAVYIKWSQTFPPRR
jgi:hypothetical protein